jgi:alpha-beta hydrolase superfamily lysophospholipase
MPEGRRIQVIARDGARLSGRRFGSTKGGKARGTILLLHGFGEPAGRLEAARCPELTRLGWDVVVPDSRGFGDSAGPFATFGDCEAADVTAWIDSIRAEEEASIDREHGPIVVWGRSMGGAIAARAAARDRRIAAIVLESPMLDLHGALTLIFRRRHLPLSSMLARLVLLRANRLAEARLDRPRLDEVAPMVGLPTLIVQGTEDSLASVSTIRTLADRFRNPACVIEVSGAGHTDTLEVGGETLWRRIIEFLDGVTESEPPRCIE